MEALKSKQHGVRQIESHEARIIYHWHSDDKNNIEYYGNLIANEQMMQVRQETLAENNQ